VINNRDVHYITRDEAQSLLEEDAKRADMREGLAIQLPILYFCVGRDYIFFNFEAFHHAAISRG